MQLKDTKGTEKRHHARSRLYLPILIRKAFGEVEVSRTQDVSRGGVCFVSTKRYYPGEEIKVACPYNKAGLNIEVAARIAHCRLVEGTSLWRYGVRYVK